MSRTLTTAAMVVRGHDRRVSEVSIMRLRTLRLAALLAACLSSGCGGSSNAPTSPTPGVVTPTSPDIQGRLRWPIDCVRDVTCGPLGYPDTDNDGKAYNCGPPGYAGHEGTDINISASQMAAGMDVFAAADGVVLWVFDGKYDNCPNANEPDCSASGTTVCTGLGSYCGTGSCCCYWCFAGGNVIVIRHTAIPGVFATRYDHLRKNSIIVTEGQSVQKGQRIAQAASAGRSSGPHLHFEVWGSGFYMPVDPWAGPCGPNTDNSLWEFGVQSLDSQHKTIDEARTTATSPASAVGPCGAGRGEPHDRTVISTNRSALSSDISKAEDQRSEGPSKKSSNRWQSGVH